MTCNTHHNIYIFRKVRISPEKKMMRMKRMKKMTMTMMRIMILRMTGKERREGGILVLS